MLKELKGDIDLGKLAVYALDECHLQGDDICNYLWGDRKDKEIIQVANERDRQTYYGAFNLWTKEFIVAPYSAVNAENTVNFIQEIKRFSIVKRLFQFFFNFKLFNPPKLKNYDAFVQLI